ncbi:hypothetical protein O0L34_g14547 [Tuta absoluta]|nr:hypothetical protein O0L34_g14547 [Tuta absoluta]
MKTKTECRVCLKNKGNIPIFGDSAHADISLEVSIFGSIQLNIEDDFPKALCKACFKLLNNAISFRKSALRADVVLQRRKHKGQFITVKVETLDDDEINSANPLKPEFLIVNKAETDFMIVSKSENVDIKNEFLTHDVLDSGKDFFDGDDGRSFFHSSNDDDDEESKNTINCKETATKVSNYECTQCNKNFISLEEYEEHHSSKLHINSSSKEIKTKLKIKVEKRRKRGRYIKNQKCDECNKQFTQNSYKKHMKKVHNIKIEHPTKKECPVCKNLFKPENLGNHKKAAHGMDVPESELVPKVKITVECRVCKKIVERRRYKGHMRLHEGDLEKNFICDVCGQRFAFEYQLNRHRSYHVNDLPFICDYCPYRGRSKALLTTHMRSHTGDYPYKCTQCSTACATKSNLNRHMRTHSGNKPFICDSCNRGFYTKLELQKHISVVHLGIKKYVCKICGAAFGYSTGLMKHERTVHKRAKMLGRRLPTYLKIQAEMQLGETS